MPQSHRFDSLTRHQQRASFPVSCQPCFSFSLELSVVEEADATHLTGFLKINGISSLDLFALVRTKASRSRHRSIEFRCNKQILETVR